MNPTFSDKVERWPLERLIPHARNARTHSEQQVAQIAGSIAEFGFVNPVLVGDDGVIVAGHGRVLAARDRTVGGVTAPPDGLYFGGVLYPGSFGLWRHPAFDHLPDTIQRFVPEASE